MANLFLTSNGFYTETIKNEFLTILKKQRTNPKAVIITTASPLKEKNKFALKTKNDFLEMGINQVDFIDVEVEKGEKLEEYNIIYINGGNPFRLLYFMKKSGADSILKSLSKQNAILIGASAGAVILGPSIDVVQYFSPKMNEVGLNNFTALALTEIAIFPHYDREDAFKDASGKSIEDRLIEFERVHDISITRLRDDEYILSNR
ncbi:Type 1 glutamine amidotransferase-like domain-containing protein [Niallia sp.]|uniref:Type 1 glutamine amidotransferase-like domain-containing protein n=1 Tax=Niallia sp. TaxID=2837523 RepID=UPI0028973C89|nr:Type 1 glutamine amidotransferase-like domain-containing protein [Niallia sp.]